MQNQNPILNELADERGDNWVDLGLLMPGLKDGRVRFLFHRPLPENGKIVELKVIRQRQLWWLVITVDAEVPKEYPLTGKSCGIDPGLSTPATMVGEDMVPGVEGSGLGPKRPLTRSLKKIKRLQRKLDRQRRKNNPGCYREDGTWIKGRRLTNISNGMRETEDRLAQAHARCADIRKDCWMKTAEHIFREYDTIFFGGWKDGTPQQKGKARKRRKQMFAETGEKRAKGQGARQRTREKVNRDNALGLFRDILQEKAQRSQGKKRLVIVKERNTLRSCRRCGALEGPTGQQDLGKRRWTCPECRFDQDRDRASAWNILQVGLRQAGGQPVTEGRVVPLVAVRRADCGSNDLGIEQNTASSQAESSSCEALARAEHTVTSGDNSNVDERGTDWQQSGPQPLAAGTVSPNNTDDS